MMLDLAIRPAPPQLLAGNLPGQQGLEGLGINLAREPQIGSQHPAPFGGLIAALV
jgi:hypothetical protein